MQNVLVREIDNQGPKRLQQNINQMNGVIRENNASTTPLHVIQPSFVFLEPPAASTVCN